jgi:hypothetical protein
MSLAMTLVAIGFRLCHEVASASLFVSNFFDYLKQIAPAKQ